MLFAGYAIQTSKSGIGLGLSLAYDSIRTDEAIEE
jgi:hypothetical protein